MTGRHRYLRRPAQRIRFALPGRSARVIAFKCNIVESVHSWLNRRSSAAQRAAPPRSGTTYSTTYGPRWEPAYGGWSAQQFATALEEQGSRSRNAGSTDNPVNRSS
jgi:hypothetical protein